LTFCEKKNLYLHEKGEGKKLAKRPGETKFVGIRNQLHEDQFHWGGTEKLGRSAKRLDWKRGEHLRKRKKEFKASSHQLSRSKTLGRNKKKSNLTKGGKFLFLWGGRKEKGEERNAVKGGKGLNKKAGSSGKIERRGTIIIRSASTAGKFYENSRKRGGKGKKDGRREGNTWAG